MARSWLLAPAWCSLEAPRPPSLSSMEGVRSGRRRRPPTRVGTGRWRRCPAPPRSSFPSWSCLMVAFRSPCWWSSCWASRSWSRRASRSSRVALGHSCRRSTSLRRARPSLGSCYPVDPARRRWSWSVGLAMWWGRPSHSSWPTLVTGCCRPRLTFRWSWCSAEVPQPRCSRSLSSWCWWSSRGWPSGGRTQLTCGDLVDCSAAVVAAGPAGAGRDRCHACIRRCGPCSVPAVTVA